MFIEGMRRAKNKWRVGVGVLLGLIVISLVLSFAFFGSSIQGVSDSSQATGILESAEAAAEAAAQSAKDADGDMTVQGQAAASYLSLAAYCELYLEDPADAYKEALKYAQNMVKACGGTEAADYNTAYGYVISANAGLGDVDALSAAFLESLSLVTLDESYIQSYYSAMSALGATDQFVADMDEVKSVLKEQIKEEPAEEEAADDEDGEDGEDGEETVEAEEATPAALLEYVEELITSAKAEQNTAE